MENSDESVLPLEFDSFKLDAKNFFNLSDKELELILNELENKGTDFSAQDIGKVVKTGNKDLVRLKNILTYILPLMNENKEKSKSELVSLGLDKQKIEFFIDKISTLNKSTFQASKILTKVRSYLNTKKHMAEMSGELSFVPIDIEMEEKVYMLPIINIKMRTHHGEDDELIPQEISMTLDAGRLRELISDLQNMLSKVESDSRRIKGLLGNKSIITAGDE